MVNKLPKIVEFAQMKIERQTANSKTGSEFKVFERQTCNLSGGKKGKSFKRVDKLEKCNSELSC
jgi:hypothetical protein